MRPVYPDRDGILDVLGCLTRETLATLRNQSQLDFQPEHWPESLSVQEEPVLADSLELLTLAGHVNRLFSLDETGLEDNLLRRRSFGDWADLIMKSMNDGEGRPLTTGLRFLSSGSTGTPREHVHSWLNLGREATHLAECLPQRRRIICLAPRHHIFGFIFGTLLPQALQLPVLREQEAERAILRGLEPGDLLVAYPLRWQYIESSRANFPDDIIGITSTGPCEPSLIDALQAKGLSSMVEIFGSTDTAGIGIRDDHRAPYELFPWWQATEGGDGLSERWAIHVESVWRLPDELVWEGDRQFRPAGRRDNMVQVGGINVSPDHVARRLCTHPAVAEASVRLADNGRLKAFIVPCAKTRETLDAGTLRAWMQNHLPDHERPAELRFGQALPRNPLGKLNDWAS